MPARRQFPLADWIEDHLDLPHQLGSSGMKNALRSTREHLERGPRSEPDDDALQAELGERLDVDPERVFLTHGASEGNGLVLQFLGRELASELGRAPTFHGPRPEYPPLFDVARWSGFRETDRAPADLLLRSNPNNPTGLRADLPTMERTYAGIPNWLVDETFREFTDAPSFAREGRRGIWQTGTMTKAFGADHIRLGWVVPPPEAMERFRTYFGLVTDEIPHVSVALARDLLADAPRILAESRGIFARNRDLVRKHLPGVGEVAAPMGFDRPGMADTEPMASAALAAGILVCPGKFFEDPGGIRLGLTRPSFPDDFAAYRTFRERFVRA